MKLKMVGVSYVLIGLMTIIISLVTLFLPGNFSLFMLTASLTLLGCAGAAMIRLGYMLLKLPVVKQPPTKDTWSDSFHDPLSEDYTYPCFEEWRSPKEEK
jgi:hypothetical protein